MNNTDSLYAAEKKIQRKIWGPLKDDLDFGK